MRNTMSGTTMARCLSILAAVAACLAVAWALADERPATRVDATFYVSTEGNDTWSGSLAAANAEKTDGPFATLENARDALRAIDRKGHAGAAGGIGPRGKVFLAKTFVLGPKDAGTRQAPVVFAAYPGEKPILSGGRRVGGWGPTRTISSSAICPAARAASGSSGGCLPTASLASAPAGPRSTPTTTSTAAGRGSRPRPSPTAARPSATNPAGCRAAGQSRRKPR